MPQQVRFKLWTLMAAVAVLAVTLFGYNYVIDHDARSRAYRERAVRCRESARSYVDAINAIRNDAVYANRGAMKRRQQDPDYHPRFFGERRELTDDQWRQYWQARIPAFEHNRDFWEQRRRRYARAAALPWIFEPPR
jgi:hypothetical protein